jgi:hypothetical protein
MQAGIVSPFRRLISFEKSQVDLLLRRRKPR